MCPTLVGIRPLCPLRHLTLKAIREPTAPLGASGIHHRSFVLHSNSTFIRHTPERESVITLPIERRYDTSEPCKPRYQRNTHSSQREIYGI